MPNRKAKMWKESLVARRRDECVVGNAGV